MRNLTTQEFKDEIFNWDEEGSEFKLKAGTPTIVDFYADWCGPCKMVAPILEELEKEYDGKIQVVKVNVDTESEVSMAFGIRSIPSLLFAPVDGEPNMAQGALSKAALDKAIQDLLV